LGESKRETEEVRKNLVKEKVKGEKAWGKERAPIDVA